MYNVDTFGLHLLSKADIGFRLKVTECEISHRVASKSAESSDYQKNIYDCN